MKSSKSQHPSRRDLIRTMGVVAGLPIVGSLPLSAQSTCAAVPTPPLTEGPYFVDEDLSRQDIRFDPTDGAMQPGLPLSLTINVSQLTNCQTAPLTGAFIDLWHCNALGVYSDVGMQSSTGRKYLRGYQATNREGNVYFLTIYPGWYQGRSGTHTLQDSNVQRSGSNLRVYQPVLHGRGVYGRSLKAQPVQHARLPRHEKHKRRDIQRRIQHRHGDHGK